MKNLCEETLKVFDYGRKGRNKRDLPEISPGNNKRHRKSVML